MNQNTHTHAPIRRTTTRRVFVSVGVIVSLFTFAWGYSGEQLNSRVDRSISLFELWASTGKLIEARGKINTDLFNLTKDREFDPIVYEENFSSDIQDDDYRNLFNEHVSITLAIANCSSTNLCDHYVSCKLFSTHTKNVLLTNVNKVYVERAFGEKSRQELEQFVCECRAYDKLAKSNEFVLSLSRWFPTLSIPLTQPHKVAACEEEKKAQAAELK